MSSEGVASDLLSQLDEIEAHIGRCQAWRRKARRYLFIKLPATGALLYASARFDILVVVAPLMLLVGTLFYIAPWLRIRALERQREWALLGAGEPPAEGNSSGRVRL